MSGEPPFTQQEVDAYAEVLVNITLVNIKNTAYNELQGKSKEFLELLKAHGFSYKRFYFLTGKIPMAISMAVDGRIHYMEGWPDSIQMTPEEVAIVERSWEKLARPGTGSLEEAREYARAVQEERERARTTRE
jgi:hypothetical protein